MEEALETPLEQAHRPIKKCNDMVIVIKRNRIGEVVRLDAETLKSVSIQTEQAVIRNISGNVTRYNILSGIGRFYDDNLGKTVSFKLEESASSSQRRRIHGHFIMLKSWSRKISLDVKRVVSAKGVIRRYLVQNVARA